MEDRATNELTILNTSVGGADAYLDASAHVVSESFPLLQGVNPNGPVDLVSSVMSTSNEILHLDDSQKTTMLIKKPCPLEMSIKAANLQTEFESDGFFSGSIGLQHPITTFGPLIESEPVQPLVLDPAKPIIGIPPTPLQVLLVQFQPEIAPILPEPNVPAPAIKEIDQTNFELNSTEPLICEVDDDDNSIVEVEVIEKKKPVEEPLVMKFRKVPSKNNLELNRSRSKWNSYDWSESDDESLADIAKRKRGDKCCSRHCFVKVSLKKQHIARHDFNNLESLGKGDLYLANCVKAVEKKNNCEELPPSSWSDSDDDISMEIAHESNGNQRLSDEIQNAIKESLKDQQNHGEKLVDCDWQYAIVVQNRLRIVCLKFLLSVLQITETRLVGLKEKIMNGEVLDRLPVTELRNKYTEVWEIAKRHLDTVSCTPLPYCKTQPPHLTTFPIGREELFQQFQEFYMKEKKDAFNVDLQSYEKFLHAQKISYANKKTCAACEWSSNMKQKQKRKSKSPRGDVFSLMLNHLKTMPFKVPKGCCSPQPHKFFSPSTVTIPMLYEEYRKYFLKETNSELGLRYAIYESLLLRNPCFTIADFDLTKNDCPKCNLISKSVPQKKRKKIRKQKDRKKKRLKTTNGR